MNAVHLTTTINTHMKILDIIQETSMPPDKGKDPQGFLKWWFENKPANMAVAQMPKEGLLKQAQAEYLFYEPIYKAQYGMLYPLLRSIGIIVPILQYHAAMIRLNKELEQDPSKVTEVLQQRQLLAGWLVTSIIVPRLTVALSTGLITKTLSVWFEYVASTGGKAGARAKAIIALGGAALASIASIIMMTPSGQKWMMDGVFLPLIIYGIGYPATAFFEWIWHLLPENLRNAIDKAEGTDTLQKAIDQDSQTQKDLDFSAPGWEDEKAKADQQRQRWRQQALDRLPKGDY